MKRDLIPPESLSFEEQYASDLALVQNEEERIVEQGGEPRDFFDAMGEVARGRLHG